MKKTLITISSISVIIFITVFLLDFKKKRIQPVNIAPEKNGLVYNEEVAIKIAEAIWLPIYGGEIYNHKPFKAVLIDSVWVIDGTVHTTLGGAPHIKIRKMDGKVLDVTHYQ